MNYVHIVVSLMWRGQSSIHEILLPTRMGYITRCEDNSVNLLGMQLTTTTVPAHLLANIITLQAWDPNPGPVRTQVDV